MNKLKNIRWKIVSFVSLSLIGLIGLVLLMSLINKKSEAQLCTEVRVIIDGKEAFIDQNDITELIQQDYGAVEGMLLKDIPLHEIENSLESLPYVSDAQVHLDMDGLMQVKVKQREAILRVINQNGQEYYIDVKGLKIPVTLKYVPRVMVASGYISEGMTEPLDTVESDVVRNMLKLVRHIEGDELWGNHIVQIYVNQYEDIELVPRIGNQQIVLGDAQALEDKLGRLKVFYTDILPTVGADAYKAINLKYEGQIVCERKEGWFLDSLQMIINRINQY